jgi:hypothetical protein
MKFYQGPTKMQHNIIVQSCFTHLERRARLPFCQDYEMSFLSRAWALSGLRVVIVVVMPSRQVAASVTRRMYRRLTPRTQPQLDCFPIEFFTLQNTSCWTSESFQNVDDIDGGAINGRDRPVKFAASLLGALTMMHDIFARTLDERVAGVKRLRAASKTQSPSASPVLKRLARCQNDCRDLKACMKHQTRKCSITLRIEDTKAIARCPLNSGSMIGSSCNCRLLFTFCNGFRVADSRDNDHRSHRAIHDLVLRRGERFGGSEGICLDVLTQEESRRSAT